MNVAMENTKEVVDGDVKAQFGDAFIRGNNGAWGGDRRVEGTVVVLTGRYTVLYISAMEDI